MISNNLLALPRQTGVGPKGRTPLIEKTPGYSKYIYEKIIDTSYKVLLEILMALELLLF